VFIGCRIIRISGHILEFTLNIYSVYILSCRWALQPLRQLYRISSPPPLGTESLFFPSKKVKWCRYRPGVAQRVGRGIALLFHDRDTRRGWVVRSTPRPPVPPRNTRYPFYRRLGGPQGRSGWPENLVPTGIRSQTVQPVVSRYTDWTTRSTFSPCSSAYLISWSSLEGLEIRGRCRFLVL
jgi:hypothetical protein